MNCAHLGCPVEWFPQSGLFMCPCHGGVYYADGERASGPPPRGLFACVWRVRDGKLEVQAPHYPTLQDTGEPARRDEGEGPMMRRLLSSVGRWLDARLGFRASILPMLTHPIPRGAAGPMGWWYVFGSASMTLLIIQVVTGIGLALVYVPTADKAYESLLYLNYEQPLGGLLRAMHYYAGSGMVVMVLAHMTQVFLHGAYKYPSELTWVVGVFLLLCTLGMFFSGQVLRWDPDAYWGLAVAGSMAGRVPVIGPAGRPAGPGRAGDRRRLAEPVLRAARLRHPRRPAGLFVALHLWLVLKRGISEPPGPGSAGRSRDLRRGVRGGAEARRAVPGRGHAQGRRSSRR